MNQVLVGRTLLSAMMSRPTPIVGAGFKPALPSQEGNGGFEGSVEMVVIAAHGRTDKSVRPTEKSVSGRPNTPVRPFSPLPEICPYDPFLISHAAA